MTAVLNEHLRETGRKAPPGLYRDRSFWGMTATQFLGAFNDNVFKQLVLLLCVDYVAHRGLARDPYQTAAGLLFALPFVLLSGFAGYLSDRYSKRRIVVLSKLAEIVVMAAGMLVFLRGEMFSDGLLTGLFVVLALMSAQSAFFGPSKYGILPELLSEHDLPRANGLIQMTTFLAIIFGQAVCGIAKQQLDESQLWWVSAGCIGIAVLGTWTALQVRSTPVANGGLKLTPRSFVVDRGMWRVLRGDAKLMGVLLISSLFWFLAGVMPMAVNNFGKLQMGYNDLQTSLLVASIGIGIAGGCLVSGRLSHERVRFGLVRCGTCVMLLMLAALATLPHAGLTERVGIWSAALLLVGVGAGAGLFAVPLQVFLQARPPAELKGRMIATMNIFNWVGILGAAVFYQFCAALFLLEPATAGDPPVSVISWTFALMAIVLAPVALLYRPSDEALD